MPITHLLFIDGQDVSPWLVRADVDMMDPAWTQNEVQRCDLTISNPKGRFDGAFKSMEQWRASPSYPADWKPYSEFFLILISIEYSSDKKVVTSYSQLVFTGKCQHIDIGYTTIKIKGSTDKGVSNAYIKWDIDYHFGPNTFPIVQNVADMDHLKLGDVVYSDFRIREINLMRDQSGCGSLDFAAKVDGFEIFHNENDLLIFAPPETEGSNPSFTGRMKEPQHSESAIGLCTKVKVVGNSFRKVWEAGSEFPIANQQEASYTTTEDDLKDLLQTTSGGPSGAELAAALIEGFGELDAAVFFDPDCGTYEECKYRAKKLLSIYLSYWNRTLPAVVGRTPRIRSKVTYSYRREQGDVAGAGAGVWQDSPEQSGRVVRAKTTYSGDTGWYCLIEIQPWGLSKTKTDELYGAKPAPAPTELPTKTPPWAPSESAPWPLADYPTPLG